MLIYFYLPAAAIVVIADVVPLLQTRFIPYGKLLSKSMTEPKSKSWLINLLDRLAAWRLPKHWFWHFYLVGILSSILYDSIDHQQVALSSWLYYFHLSRRLIEQLFLFRHRTESQIHISHYFVGLIFYITTPLAVRSSPDISNQFLSLLGSALFVFASLNQFRCHYVLASLPSKSYLLPANSWFSRSTSPHYFFEVMIYIAFCIMNPVSLDLIACMTWVSVNLYVTARHTWTYYRSRFGKVVDSRNPMIPF